MIIPSFSPGYNFVFELANNANIILSPYLSYGHYFRSLVSTESTTWFNRPVITCGFDFAINTEVKTISSLGLYVSLIMDNSPVIMPGFVVKTAYTWGSIR